MTKLANCEEKALQKPVIDAVRAELAILKKMAEDTASKVSFMAGQ